MDELPVNEFIDKLIKKNEKYYKAFGRLHENEKFLVEKDYKKEMAKIIFSLYKSEIKKLLLEYEAEQAPDLYRLESIAAAKKPRRGLFRRNRAMKALDEQIDAIVDKYFDELSGKTNASKQLPVDTVSETMSTPTESPKPIEKQPITDPQPPEMSEISSTQSEATEQPTEPLPAKALPETSEAPSETSEALETPSQESALSPKKKHKRGNKTVQAPIEPPKETSETTSAQSKATAEPLSLEEIPTDGGAQMCLHIP